MQGKGKALIAWVAGGAGVILVYSAYRNQSPLSVLKGNLSGDTTRTPIEDAATATASFNGDTPSTWRDSIDSRAEGLRNGTTALDLVPIGSQPRFKLDRSAAASFARVEAMYGKKIPIQGSFRSREEQARGYAESPGTFAAPGNSLHEKGLAVDLDPSIQSDWDNPALIAAFTLNGWFRRGKRISWNGITRPEPWHWSYGVPG